MHAGGWRFESARLHQNWLETYSCLHFAPISVTDPRFMNGEPTSDAGAWLVCRGRCRVIGWRVLILMAMWGKGGEETACGSGRKREHRTFGDGVQFRTLIMVTCIGRQAENA